MSVELIAHVVVNVEAWALEEPMPRSLLPGPHGVNRVPDVPTYSWVEYGLRRGLPRIMRLFAEHGVRASASMNASIIATHPEVVEAVRDAGWEIVAHGVTQRALTAEADEAGVIERAAELIAEFTGERPRGWLGPGLQESFSTPSLLKRAGFDYVCDWALDDVPTRLETPHGPLVSIPYPLELNDSLLHAIQHYPSDELYLRLVRTLETFEQEEGSKLVTLGLHPHLMGVPHRFPHLSRCIELLRSRSDIAFLSGSEIVDRFAE